MYVPRRFWRWWDCEDGQRRKYWGDVISVGGADAVNVTYDNGDVDTMTEDSLLKVFDTMKKEILQRLRKRKARDGAKVSTKRARRV